MYNKRNPLVSIIVPVYNTERFLEECLSSIIKQTYQNIEVLVVNDGSTDCSGGICDVFSNQDSRIKVIHTDNQGVVKARLTALKFSNGDYYTFVDSDDYLESNAIQILVNTIVDYNVDLVVCQRFKKFKSSIINDIKRPSSGMYSRYDIDNLLRTNSIYDEITGIAGFPFEIWGKLYKKKYIQKILLAGNDLWYAEDMVGILTLLYDIESMYILDDALYVYRERTGQATQVYKSTLLENDTKLFQFFWEFDTRGYLKNQIPQRALMELERVLAVAARTLNSIEDFRQVFKKSLELYPIWSRSNKYPNVKGIRNNIKLLLIKYRLVHIYYWIINYKL